MATSSNLHELQAGAQLHVPGYFQSSDPGAVGAGKLWVDTSTAGLGYCIAKYRNAGDTAWLTDGPNGPFAWTTISPAALTTNTNDYTPTDLETAVGLRLTATGAVNLTGITGGVDGRPLFISNIGSNTITLKNNVTSTAGNRFLFDGDLALAANQGVWIIYDGTTSRWRLYGWGTTVGGGGSTPTGPAGGSLNGTYPNPGIANGTVGTAELAAGAVTVAKIGSQFWSNEVAVSDETTPITANPIAITFRQMGAVTLNAGNAGIRASLTTAATVGTVQVDILQNGVSIFTTPLTIDANEKTSTTAAVPPILSVTSLTDNAELVVNIVNPGTSGDATGLKIQFIGVQTA